MVEASTELVAEDLEFEIEIADHVKDVFFEYHQTLAREPYDVVIKLEGFSVARGIESSEPTCADEFPGEED